MVSSGYNDLTLAKEDLNDAFEDESGAKGIKASEEILAEDLHKKEIKHKLTVFRIYKHLNGLFRT